MHSISAQLFPYQPDFVWAEKWLIPIFDSKIYLTPASSFAFVQLPKYLCAACVNEISKLAGTLSYIFPNFGSKGGHEPIKAKFILKSSFVKPNL